MPIRRIVFALLALAVAARAEEIDLAVTCVHLGVVQEPELDAAKMKEAIDALAEKAKKRLEGAKGPKEVVAGLNEVLLMDRKVSYISNKYWRDSTLAASLLRGQGNCLSTATLYAVIGQRLGLPIHAVVVPRHAFARFDDGKTRINIETTNQGLELPDEYYKAMGEWTDGDRVALGYGESLSTAQFAAELHTYAGRHLEQVEQHEGALAETEQAIRLWPANEGYAIQRLSLLLGGLGRRDEALRGYQDLLEKTQSGEVRVRVLMAEAGDLQAHEKHPEALDVLRTAFHDAPKQVLPDVLGAMASSYRTLRRFPEALLAQDLALSAQFQPEAGDFTELAIYYKNANQLEDAVRCLKEALERNPEDWNTRLILAGYLIRAKHDDEGWAMFKTVEKPRALAKTPDILNYVNTEVDFDRYRDDADFKELVETHRKRLLK